MDYCFAEIPSAQCERELYCFCRLRDAIDDVTEVAEGDLELQCWFFDKSYTNMHLMRGRTLWRRALEFEVRQRTVVRNPNLGRRNNLKLFAVTLKDRYWPYVSVPAFWHS